jgi:hypothetical protein
MLLIQALLPAGMTAWSRLALELAGGGFALAILNAQTLCNFRRSFRAPVLVPHVS